MAEKKTPAVSPATESAADPKTRKTAAKAPARRGRPPLAPELYVELNGKQYNITDVIDRAKADYRATHKVGVQSCKVYVKPEEGTAYYVINKVSGKLDLYFFCVPGAAHRTTEHKQNTQKTLLQNSCRSVLFCAWMPCYFFALPQRNFRFCSGSGSGISNT